MMGSWDETCGLTGLPVSPGDKVYFQVIAKNWCSSVPPDGATGYYRPVLYPLVGVYDDYGRIRDVKKNFAFDWLDRYLDQIIGVGVEKLIETHAISYKLPYEALDKQYSLQMASCFFLADAYNEARDEMEGYQKQSWDKAVKDLFVWVERERNMGAALSSLINFPCDELTVIGSRTKLLGSDAELWFRDRYGREFLCDYFCDHPEDFALIKPFVEFDISFGRLRRQYMPLRGSQCWSYELHRKIAMWTVRRVNQIEKEFAENGDLLSDYD